MAQRAVETAVNEHDPRTAAPPEARDKAMLYPQTPMAGTATGARGARYRLSAALAVAMVVAVAVAWWSLREGTTTHYTTAPVTRGAISRAVIATGTVNPELTIIVGTYVSGVIQQLYCDYNTVVKTGQLCAKIDPRPYQTIVDQSVANLAVAKAQLEKDKANLAYAELAFDRAARLVKTNAISQDTYDNARNAYDQARAQIAFDEATIQQRQAALDAAQVNLDYTNIISPVDGVVVSRNVTMGQTVAASFQTPTLFLIATDLTKMEVDTNVSESDIGEIKAGNTATFTVDAFPNRTFTGTVTQVRQSPQTIQNVVTYDVVVTVANNDLALKPGMTAATAIIVERKDDVIRVPNAALRYRPGGPTLGEPGKAQVWVLRDGRPAPIAVVRGLSDDSFTEIASGDVKSGDQVITAEQNVVGGNTGPRLRF
jgi:HlyD family secretion protein